MENRFGVKDFVLMLLLVVLIVSVWLGMKQYDRQWDKVPGLEQSLKDIQRTLARGVAVNTGGGGTSVGPASRKRSRIAGSHENARFFARRSRVCRSSTPDMPCSGSVTAAR